VFAVEVVSLGLISRSKEEATMDAQASIEQQVEVVPARSATTK